MDLPEAAKLDMLLGMIAIKYTQSNSVGYSKEGVKRQDRVNARVRYIEGDMQDAEYAIWVKSFDNPPPTLTEAEKTSFLKGLSGVAIASDAFFPFRDSIDHCSQLGVRYVAQPGGSVADQEVIGACDGYGMTMAFSDLRLFHH